MQCGFVPTATDSATLGASAGCSPKRPCRACPLPLGSRHSLRRDTRQVRRGDRYFFVTPCRSPSLLNPLPETTDLIDGKHMTQELSIPSASVPGQSTTMHDRRTARARAQG